jgi:hypothetical protein
MKKCISLPAWQEQKNVGACVPVGEFPCIPLEPQASRLQQGAVPAPFPMVVYGSSSYRSGNYFSATDYTDCTDLFCQRQKEKTYP